jgi:hypothetical protein
LAEPLRIEAPSADLAHLLMQRLQAFPTNMEQDEGRCEVRVTLVGDTDRAVVAVLDGVDGWLVDHRIDSVRIHLDRRVYTLTRTRQA